MILVDTNIPLRIAQIGHPHRRAALESLSLLTLRDQEHFAIGPQNLYEMYVVLTRPASENGFGFTCGRAASEIASTRAVFELLSESSQVYAAWEGLIVKYDVPGKRAHDLRLVALMIHHRVPKILTFNDADFKQFAEIEPLNPFDLLNVKRK